jgi:two-component system, NtrC family, sensor histidine kinase HydH
MGVPNRLRALLVTLVILVILVAHFTTDPMLIWWHVVYQDICYIPILVAAYWFGVPGGLATSVAAGLGTVIHFHHGWHNNEPFVVSEYGQAIAFVITGVVGGALATAERRATRRHEQARRDVESAHAELRTSHQQLIRADRLSSLGEIAAGLAHEIGNPLGGIKGALEIIAAKAADGTPEAEFAALASREVARLESLIEEFLSYARPHDPHRSSVDLFDVLDRVVSLIAREAEARGVSIELRRTPAPRIALDADQMVQVFVNIVLNAVQASPARGRVDIGVRQQGSRLAVDIRDQGQGIRADHLARIFDPFFSTKKRGTGLGLSISNRIVRSHGGSIEVLQPGQGTIVRVLLPTTNVVPEAAVSSISEAQP